MAAVHTGAAPRHAGRAGPVFKGLLRQRIRRGGSVTGRRVIEKSRPARRPERSGRLFCAGAGSLIPVSACCHCLLHIGSAHDYTKRREQVELAAKAVNRRIPEYAGQ